ncbi:MAG: NUDIX domain-containing protein [Alphaproteobacteria bacterium]|nr:NUDIX domain-containing protein [Alphaproteobacteria bacterium]
MHPLLYKFLSRFGQQPYARLMRGKTLGVRVAAFDSEGSVMLVKHTYSPGWILPGGGVEKGEMLHEAGLREIREEAGLIAEGPLVLHGIFSNEAVFPGDFVCTYVLRHCRREDWRPNLEIADAQFFAPDRLPEDMTAGTRRRLDEILHDQSPSVEW